MKSRSNVPIRFVTPMMGWEGMLSLTCVHSLSLRAQAESAVGALAMDILQGIGHAGTLEL